MRGPRLARVVAVGALGVGAAASDAAVIRLERRRCCCCCCCSGVADWSTCARSAGDECGTTESAGGNPETKMCVPHSHSRKIEQSKISGLLTHYMRDQGVKL